jgi:hypothetical protein
MTVLRNEVESSRIPAPAGKLCLLEAFRGAIGGWCACQISSAPWPPFTSASHRLISGMTARHDLSNGSSAP